MDIRIKKTKRSITNAFLELRTYQPLEKITVKELCEKAEINKSTFYKHYTDIFDLSSHLETETIEQILANLPHPEYVLERLKDFMVEMQAACLSQSTIIDRLFSGNQDGQLVLKLNVAIKEWIFKLYPQYRNNEAVNIYLTYAVFGGYYAMYESMKLMTAEVKPNPQVDIPALIAVMHEAGARVDNKYYQLIDQLLSIGYGFFIPSCDYVLSRLQLSEVDDQGFLNENVMLRNLRKMLAYAFSEDIGPRSRPIGAYARPELAGFLCELTELFRDCLIKVWQSDCPLEWCTASSNWLLTFTGDFLCDIERFNTNAEDSLTMMQARLMSTMIISIGSNRASEFTNWLNPYLVASWWANPSFAQNAATGISEFIRTTFSKVPYTSNEKKLAVEKMAIVYIGNLPYLIRPAVLKKLTGQSYYDRFTGIVQEDEQSLSELGDISKCIKEITVLDKAGILCGDIEAMNAATCFVLSDIDINAETFIQEFPIESMFKMPTHANYTLAQFLAELAWYFPPSKRAHLHELKRTLSLLPD